MRRWYGDNYEDSDENLRVWAHHHQVVHGPLQQNPDYDTDGIEQHTSGRGIIGVGHHYNHVCSPVSYVMVNDNGPEQDPQMMTNHIPLPPIPVLSSLQYFMLSSSVPNSYLMYQPPTMMMQQQISLLPPSRSFPTSPPPPLQPSTQTVGCDTTQQQYDQSLNDYNHSGTTNLGNDMINTRERITTNSSSYVCDLQSEYRTIAAGMTSTVINNNILSQQQLSDNDEIAETTSSSLTTKIKVANETKNLNTMIVDDNKVVGVCKQTILSAISKIIADNYESALHKLRKIIRVLDILMFNESGRGIGTAKLETVRPWWETLKDMERLVSVKHCQKNNNHSLESNVLMRAKCSYRYQVPQESCNNSRGSNANGANVHRIWRKSNNRRYRTTGKLIVEQCEPYLDRHHCLWINN